MHLAAHRSSTSYALRIPPPNMPTAYSHGTYLQHIPLSRHAGLTYDEAPSALANGAHSHRIREDERGSISPYLCIASGLLTMVALLVMLSLGDATLHRRDASNAADSAALAAAGAWADSIESAYDDAVGAGNADDLWGGVGNSVGSYAGPKARRAAETYASRNGATVTAYSVNATRRTITVAVETNSAVEGATRG